MGEKRKYAILSTFSDLHDGPHSYTFNSRGECQLHAVQVLLLKMFIISTSIKFKKPSRPFFVFTAATNVSKVVLQIIL